MFNIVDVNVPYVLEKGNTLWVEAGWLYTSFGSSKGLTSWINYWIKRYGAVESIDYYIDAGEFWAKSAQKSNRGRPMVRYILSYEFSLYISTRLNNNKSKYIMQFLKKVFTKLANRTVELERQLSLSRQELARTIEILNSLRGERDKFTATEVGRRTPQKFSARSLNLWLETREFHSKEGSLWVANNKYRKYKTIAYNVEGRYPRSHVYFTYEGMLFVIGMAYDEFYGMNKLLNRYPQTQLILQ